MSDDTKTIPHSNVIAEENTLKSMVLVFLVGLGYGFGWVGGNEWNYINIDEHEEHEEEEEEVRLLSDRIIVKEKSVQVCNGCRGRHRIESPFPPSKSRKKKSKFGDRTQKHHLTKREKDSSSCSPSKEKERKKYEHIEHGRGM